MVCFSVSGFGVTVMLNVGVDVGVGIGVEIPVDDETGVATVDGKVGVTSTCDDCVGTAVEVEVVFEFIAGVISGYVDPEFVIVEVLTGVSVDLLPVELLSPCIIVLKPVGVD